MGDVTEHGAPFPVGTDRVMDGDNAIQALAEWADAHVYAGDGAPGAPGVWATFAGAVICTAASTAAVAGTVITRARYMKIGRTVWFQGEGTMSGAITDVAVLLPNALTGVPAARVLLPGQVIVVDSAGAVVDVAGCIMHTAKDRVMPITLNGSYVDSPATASLRWSVTYETAT
jgi:hypothetical protein